MCELSPGDTLLVPAYWFVHQQLQQPACVALVLQLQPRLNKLMSRDALLMQLSRMIECWVAAEMGTANVRKWLLVSWLAALASIRLVWHTVPRLGCMSECTVCSLNRVSSTMVVMYLVAKSMVYTLHGMPQRTLLYQLESSCTQLAWTSGPSTCQQAVSDLSRHEWASLVPVAGLQALAEGREWQQLADQLTTVKGYKQVKICHMILKHLQQVLALAPSIAPKRSAPGAPEETRECNEWTADSIQAARQPVCSSQLEAEARQFLSAMCDERLMPTDWLNEVCHVLRDNE